MLHCFNCGADLPDNVVFCLQCGKPLDVPEVLEEDTVVRPKPFDPWPVEPKPVEPLPIVDPVPQPAARRRGGAVYLILGILLGAGLVIALLIVGVFMIAALQNDPKGNAPPANNKSVGTSSPTPQTPTATPTRKPSPTPTETPIENDVHFITKLRGCDIINPEGGSVNLRRYCDTRDCSTDPTTLYIQVDPGTHVEATDHQPIVTDHFSWVQVRYDNETLWVSAARIDCDQ